MLTKQSARKIAWQRVILFALAAFIFNTTEFVPVALLSDIGAGFAMPVPQVGLMMTVYAWVVALMSLPFMLLTAKVERRKLLVAVFALFVIGHAVSVFAPDYPTLLVSRIIIALAHAVFWSITAALVMRIAPTGKKAQALGLLSLGTSLAMVLGLPLGRMLGQWLGWRMTFAAIGLAALVVMVLMAKLLPRLESKNAGSLRSLPQLFRRPLLMGLYLFTVTVVSAHFTAYSYIEPFVLHIAGFGAQAATIVLLVFGLSGMAASWLFGRFYERRPLPFMFASALLLCASLLLLQPLACFQAAFFGLMFVWGTAMSCLALCMIARVLSLAPDATDVASAIYSGIFNMGIGAGALFGGLIMRGSGLQHTGWFAAALAAAAIVWLAWIQRRFHAPKETGGTR